MLLFLLKLVPLILYPVGLTCVLIVAGLVTRRRRRWQTICLVAALLLLGLASNRWVAMRLLRT